MISQPCIVQTPWKSTSWTSSFMHEEVPYLSPGSQLNQWSGCSCLWSSVQHLNPVHLSSSNVQVVWSVSVYLRVSGEMYYALGCC
jgi:hypothetical protein